MMMNSFIEVQFLTIVYVHYWRTEFGAWMSKDIWAFHGCLGKQGETVPITLGNKGPCNLSCLAHLKILVWTWDIHSGQSLFVFPTLGVFALLCWHIYIGHMDLHVWCAPLNHAGSLLSGLIPFTLLNIANPW